MSSTIPKFGCWESGNAGDAPTYFFSRSRIPPKPLAPPLQLTLGVGTILDPELVMAARRGDNRRLTDLLRQVPDEDGEGDDATPANSAAEVVVPMPVDGPAAEAAASGGSLLLGETITEGDSLLHVVAACGDGDNFLDCAKMICGKRGGRSLLLDRNNKDGDTPLHCAAGAGNASMISCLLAIAAAGGGGQTAVKALLRKPNKLEETALHGTVRAASNRPGCIDRLMAADPELACIPQEGVSPLYLAISSGEMDAAWHLLEKSGGNLSYSGPKGNNVFHAAVVRGRGGGGGRDDADSVVAMLVEWFGQDHRRLLLLRRLTSQRGMFGFTPLLQAALLSATTATTVRLLLEANESAAYLPDDAGQYPIHVAGSGDRLDHVEMLLERCPDCAALRDARGMTFIHVAVVCRWREVVKYACAQEQLSLILNAQDKQGNTALHAAVYFGDLDSFNCLIRNRQVLLDVPNGDGLTPVRLARRLVPTIFYDKLNSRSLIQESLELLVEAPRGTLPDTIDDDEKSKNLRDATQMMGVVSVLVATVAFASAFTLPGGYRSAGATAGTPLLAGRRSYAFDAFVLADTLAFVCSSMATFSLVFAGMPFMDLSVRYRCFLTAFDLMRGAGRSLLAAFALGLYVVLAPVDRAIAASVCAIILASLLGGHVETRRVVSTANAALARFRCLRKPAARLYARALRRYVLGNFWTFIIIFGLPAAIRIN